MKLTPLDIHHKEFRHSLRGYSEEEVDAFLDEVADEFERLFKENIDLAEKLEEAMSKLSEHEQMEKTVHNTLVAAQKSAEDIEENAQRESELTRKDAEIRAQEIIHEALALKQKTQNDFMKIKQVEAEFRQSFRSMLERHLSEISEIPVPVDIAAMSQQDQAAEEIVASMDSVRQPGLVASAATAQPEVPVEPAAPAFAEPIVAEPEDVDVEITPDAPADFLDEAGLPDSGFVTSIQLGEVGDENVPEPETILEDPAEFDMPTLDSLGERDDELDIEEID